MSETIYREGRIAFHHKHDGRSTHDIFVAPNFTANHYEHNDGVIISGVALTGALHEITHDDAGTMLHFACALGGTFTVTLRGVAPEALCDAVEAARLQTVEPADV